jgi:ketosteroid isomerase-like protein
MTVAIAFLHVRIAADHKRSARAPYPAKEGWAYHRGTGRRPSSGTHFVKIQHSAALAAATAAFALGPVLAAPAAPPAPPAVSDAIANVRPEAVPDMVGLHSAGLTWMKHFNAGNANGVAVLYDENAVLLPPNAAAVEGRDAIRVFLGREMNEARKAGIVFHMGAHPAGGFSGDLGWQSGTYSLTDKSGKVVETGKYLSVSKKQGRKWIYIRDTWNADAAPSAPVAPATPAAPETNK